MSLPGLCYRNRTIFCFFFFFYYPLFGCCAEEFKVTSERTRLHPTNLASVDRAQVCGLKATPPTKLPDPPFNPQLRAKVIFFLSFPFIFFLPCFSAQLEEVEQKMLNDGQVCRGIVLCGSAPEEIID